MLFSIENEHLKLTVDTLGAQMMSIRSKDGCEYLWQGDPAFWADRCPVLFPFIGRLEGKKYLCEGKEYPLGIHGFAAGAQFAPDFYGPDTLVMTLAANADTMAVYPYDFVLEITYRLVGSTVEVRNRVRNSGEKTMHFALGGHPGFRVPLEDGERFEDYLLEFSEPCLPERIGFTADSVLVSGQRTPYPLEDGRRLSLRHDLFDEDAIILRDMAHQVCLRSRSCPRSVTVSYPDMPYLGFWHWPHKPAPYVCIEPWTSLPGRAGITEDLALREDLIHLPAGREWVNTWAITIA